MFFTTSLKLVFKGIKIVIITSLIIYVIKYNTQTHTMKHCVVYLHVCIQCYYYLLVLMCFLH